MNVETKLTIKGMAIVFAIALLFPFGLNLVHHFSHDKHDHCTETGVTHFHQKTIDCELCDYQVTPITSFLQVEFTLNSFINFNTIFPQYRSIHGSYDQLHFNLRGPPVGYLA